MEGKYTSTLEAEARGKRFVESVLCSSGCGGGCGGTVMIVVLWYGGRNGDDDAFQYQKLTIMFSNVTYFSCWTLWMRCILHGVTK